MNETFVTDKTNKYEEAYLSLLGLIVKASIELSVPNEHTISKLLSYLFKGFYLLLYIYYGAFWFLLKETKAMLS